MPRPPRTRLALTLCAALAAGPILGCWAVHKRTSDTDRAPVVNTGAGASIIMPGQAPPAHPGNHHPREAGYGAVPAPSQPPAPQAPSPGGASRSASGPDPYGRTPAPPAGGQSPPPQGAPGYGSRSGSAGSGGGGVTMLGGSQIEETRHVKVNEEPQWMKYVMLPFAVVAAPFKYAADEVRGEPDAGPAVPRNEDQPRPAVRQAPPPMDYESARLQRMEQELARRETASPAAEPHTTRTAPEPGAGGIADELAALRRRAAEPSQPAPAPERAPAPRSASSSPAPRPGAAPAPDAASGRVDRDGDGRTDHWIHREDGRMTRERFDENFDGRPDRTLVYAPDAHEVVRIDEDTDFDGRVDSWTTFRDGRVTGRRVDEDGDGHVDTWSFYRDGTITRLERDADGDGFRDHVARYEEGRLVREERDDDADGRADLVKHYDGSERVTRVEEDSDGDGRMDVVSHYEGGRLKRREVLDASVLGAGAGRPTEHN